MIFRAHFGTVASTCSRPAFRVKASEQPDALALRFVLFSRGFQYRAAAVSPSSVVVERWLIAVRHAIRTKP